jgi:hypothetical protein
MQRRGVARGRGFGGEIDTWGKEGDGRSDGLA